MSRLDEARKVAQELLESLESQQLPIESTLMKAKRLARLMRDTDAQAWLDFETRGYPSGFSFSTLGTCEKYAVYGGRLTAGNKYLKVSLPELEAGRKYDEAIIDSIRSSRPTATKAKDFLEKSATEALMATQIQVQIEQKKAYVQRQGLFASLKSGIHNYATDIYLAIELGDIAQDIFEEAREDVDTFVRTHCPKAAEQLVAINERLREDLVESRSVALTSCRRLLMTVADSLFPAQTEPYKDSKGKLRIVGQEEYKNRLLAYIDSRISSDSSISLISTEIEHLASRLDAVYEKGCKGVHADVSKEEARLAVIHTYLFVGELAKISSDKNVQDAS
ncbi:MAG TPA: AbiTii domain-containing protein [Candidatus Wujingus californicus]|uniref:AbiTii domain-containing protein n=1 Tax=Candidatus Wujingus californicus TaxID=3367618 RepID=UPI004025EAE6